MSKPATLDFTAYAVGVCCASVCTSLSITEATERLNAEHPTGISSRWVVSKDAMFKCGTPNGCQCQDYPDNRHYLFNC